jgi:hypothetical protein
MLRARKEINVPLISLRTLTDKHALKKRLQAVFHPPKTLYIAELFGGENTITSELNSNGWCRHIPKDQKRLHPPDLVFDMAMTGVIPLTGEKHKHPLSLFGNIRARLIGAECLIV